MSFIYFSDFGVFNVTAYAWNFVTEVETMSDLMIIVTSAPCSPPEVWIPVNSTVGTTPLQFKMSESIAIETTAKVNCSGIMNTLKTWEINKAIVNASNLHEDLTPLTIDDIAPDTKNQAELIIPPRALTYGVYKLKFYSRMWDESFEDPMWTRNLPFERNAFTYIEVIPSPLVVKLVDANADLITRGKGQTLALDPYLYSFDPDYPLLQDQGLEFRWFCRKMVNSQTGETLPLDENGQRSYNVSALINIPDQRPTNVDDGCFGTGPGALNVTSGSVLIDMNSFQDDNNIIYEFLLEVRKNTFDYKPGFVRIAEKSLQVLVVPGIPPLMGILCADPALCFTDSIGNTYVNPSSRLALKAWCSIDDGSDCTEPMTFSWYISLPGQTQPLSEAEQYSPTGVKNIEMAVSSEFFAAFPSQEIFHVGLTAWNGNQVQGKNPL